MTDEWKPRRGQKIERLFAYIATEPDGGEGIVGVSMMVAGREMMVPLVGGDLDRMHSFRPHAELVQRVTGTPNRLVEFGIRRDIVDA